MTSTLLRCSMLLFLTAFAMGATARGQNQPAAPTLAKPDVEAELLASFKAIETALQEVRSSDTSTRAAAASQVRDFLERLQIAERAKAVYIPPPPFPSTVGFLQRRIHTALQQSARSPEALPAVEWFLWRATSLEYQVAGVDLLSRIEGPQADARLTDIITRPHPNTEAVIRALRVAAERKLPIDQGRLGSLAVSHRVRLREAARDLLQALGAPAPPPVDAATLMQSPVVRALLERMARFAPDLPDKQAEFGQVTATREWVRIEEQGYGWIRKREGARLDLQLLRGPAASFTLSERTVWKATDIDAQVADWAERRTFFQGITALNDDTWDPYERHRMHAPECLLAVWLHQAGRDDQAARILLPALDQSYSDDDAIEKIRQRMGEWQGVGMLVALAGDRNYPRTLDLARRLHEKFPDTPYDGLALKLVEELPRRQDDFAALRLPTPAEWSKLQRQLSRDAQIDYLCARLRLVNSMRASAWLRQTPQYAEPFGMTSDAMDWRAGGKTDVINPLLELLGDEPDSPVKERRRGLELSIADIPRLAKHLQSNWHALAFWRQESRDGAGEPRQPSWKGRWGVTTRELLGRAINEIAKESICDDDALTDLRHTQIDAEIARLVRWAGEKPPDDRYLEAVQKSARMEPVRQQIRWLLGKRDRRLTAELTRFVEQGVDPTWAAEATDALRWLAELDAKAACDVARRTRKAIPIVQHQAVQVLYAAGERAEAMAMLGDMLAKVDSENIPARELVAAVKLLLAENSPGAKAALERLLANDEFAGIDEHEARAPILRSVTSAGWPHAMRFYLRMLDVRINKIGSLEFAADTPVAHVFVAEALSVLGDGDPAVDKIYAIDLGKEDERVAATKEWLQKRLKAMPAPAHHQPPEKPAKTVEDGEKR